MTPEQMEAFLAGDDHLGTAVLSVGRPERGPLSVPLAFAYRDGRFEFHTKASRRHTRLFLETGRATVLVHHERYEGETLERYVMAEGPIRLEPPAAGAGEDPFRVAVLTPERLIAVVYGP